MKVDFSQQIVCPGIKTPDLTLGQVALQALNSVDPQAPLQLSEAMLRGALAIKVAEGGEHDLSVEDAAKIRSLLPRVWTPIVVAVAAKMLDGGV